MKKAFNKVLIIDDDETCGFINKRIMQNLDICNEIVMLPDGKDALEYIQKESKKPVQKESFLDLILLDINMPFVNGFQFLEQLKETGDNEKFEVVLVSTSRYSNDLAQSLNYKIVGFLNKPLNRDKLLELLEKTS